MVIISKCIGGVGHDETRIGRPLVRLRNNVTDIGYRQALPSGRGARCLDVATERRVPAAGQPHRAAHPVHQYGGVPEWPESQSHEAIHRRQQPSSSLHPQVGNR